MHAMEKRVFFLLLLRFQTEHGNGRITFNQSRIDVRTKEPNASVRICVIYCCMLELTTEFKKCESKAPYS